MSFYKRLISFKKDETKAEFSKRLGIGQNLLRFWEIGDDRVEPKISTVKPIAKKLGVNLSWLLLGEGEKWADGRDDANEQEAVNE
jgi:transcriptional regulator with XRE-family HTH domain